MTAHVFRAENDVGGPGCQFDITRIAGAKEIPDFNPPLEQIYTMQLAWAMFCAEQGSVDAAELKAMNHMRKVDPEMCKVFWGDAADNNVDARTGRRTFRCAKRLDSEDSRPSRDRARNVELREGDKDISEIEDAMAGARQAGNGPTGSGGMTGLLGGMGSTNLGDMSIMKLLRGFGPGDVAPPAGDADSKLLAEMFKDLSKRNGVKEFSIDGGDTAVKTARIPEPPKAPKVRSGAAVRSKSSGKTRTSRRGSISDCEVPNAAPIVLAHSMEVPNAAPSVLAHSMEVPPEEAPLLPPSLTKHVSLLRSR